MPWNKLNPNHEAHLRDSLGHGRVVLFTGAGFSLGARATAGPRLPSSSALATELWGVLFSEDFDGSSLGDIYSVGVRKKQGAIRTILETRLRVDPHTLPECYKTWFSAPWARIYTVNVDTLDEAAAVAYDLPRPLTPLSALSSEYVLSRGLDSIHLNGTLADFPNLTFSEEQYGERTVHWDSWYQTLMTDLLNKPVLFVGSTLNEPPLWHYIALVGQKGTRGRAKRSRVKEHRPRSYLVTKHLTLARQAKLEQFNVIWIQASQEEFVHEFLANCREEIASGLDVLTTSLRPTEPGFEEVSDLRQDKAEHLAEFLRGREPTWSDLTEGYAIVRQFEDALFHQSLAEATSVVAVTGTAGSGKSTTLKRLALRYDDEGKVVLWLNEWTELSIARLRNQAKARKPDAVFVDNVDRFGNSATNMIMQLTQSLPNCLIVIGIRSSKYHNYSFAEEFSGRGHLEFIVPHLTDGDISLLLDALASANRLGILAGHTHMERISAFKHQAGRQLLVALYQATTGEPFEQRISSECHELPDDLLEPYAILAVVTAFGAYLTLEELMAAIGDYSNLGLERIKTLKKMSLVTEDREGRLLVRHRRIAEMAIEYYKREGQLGDPIAGLVFTLAAQSTPTASRYSRKRKLLVRLLQHDTLRRLLADSVYQVRMVYETVEDLLDRDSHYWLQRGRFEAEMGDVRDGKLFVDQARALNRDDLFVRTGWADATLRYACSDPTTQQSIDLAEDALDELRDAIRSRGETSPYPFDVLGRRVLAWCQTAALTPSTRNDLLGEAERSVQYGSRLHPRVERLQDLYEELRGARLRAVVESSGD